MRFTGGYIKMHRSFLEWEWYTDLNTRVLFQHMIILANYKDTRLRGKVIKRGQIVTSMKDLAKSSGISVQSVRTSLDKLKLTNEVTIKSTSEGSTITVVKYNSYQDANEQTNKPATNEQQTSNKRSTTYKESKESKESKEVNIPTFEIFKSYALEQDKTIEQGALKMKYKSWVENDWKDGNDRTIKNWKVKLLNTIPHLPKVKKEKWISPI